MLIYRHGTTNPSKYLAKVSFQQPMRVTVTPQKSATEEAQAGNQLGPVQNVPCLGKSPVLPGWV